MKKQWLSMILALCMVLCLTPTTARAAEGEKTCTLTINVEVEGLPKGVQCGRQDLYIRRQESHKWKASTILCL